MVTPAETVGYLNPLFVCVTEAFREENYDVGEAAADSPAEERFWGAVHKGETLCAEAIMTLLGSHIGPETVASGADTPELTADLVRFEKMMRLPSTDWNEGDTDWTNGFGGGWEASLEMLHSILVDHGAIARNSPPEPEGQMMESPVEDMRHNHMTRDVKPDGECPACDRLTARF